ncbi:uncharacterized protein LOC134220375 [Armigeres subalbatus]|uniref:uncharacterized protein LOC134220375 n=1 Tax=Armigeres subalbatus TaxID=124917 RepID=UPI002ED2FEC2
MGVSYLDSFIRNNVPGGFFLIEMESEIRKCADLAVASRPIIVIDLVSLYGTLSKYDEKGLPFGGRINLAYSVIDQFFKKFKSFGVELVFFDKGAVQEQKDEDWCNRQDTWYMKNLMLFDAVDEEIGVDDFLRLHWNILSFRIPLAKIARKHGLYKMAPARDCHREIATYANKYNAMAIISNNSDFLIYEGSWRYWSSQVLELSSMKTREYNRPALLSYLGLTFQQMPLFATLCGANRMPREFYLQLHSELRITHHNKVPDTARIVRELPLAFVQKTANLNNLSQILYNNLIDKDLMEQFEMSLDSYRTTISINTNSSQDDPVSQVLSTLDSPFHYFIWRRIPLDIAVGVIDMRQPGFDNEQLLTSLILRMAGIILFHKKPARPTQCPIIIKLSHTSSHQIHWLDIQYPPDVEPPTVLELFSTDSTVSENVLDIKYQLLAWIASDSLHPGRLQRIPKELRLTVYTLYYLMEQKVLELFEADLFLQVAYDVIYKRYDPNAVEYPTTIKGRPYRVVFLFQKVYAQTSKAFRLLGVHHGETVRDDLPFDGVLFHDLYDEWSRGLCDLDRIRDYRIYEANGILAPDEIEEPGWKTVQMRKRRNIHRFN